MENRRGIEDVIWAFAIISGVVGFVELVSKPKKAQAAKINNAITLARLNKISKGVSALNAKLGNK